MRLDSMDKFIPGNLDVFLTNTSTVPKGKLEVDRRYKIKTLLVNNREMMLGALLMKISPKISFFP